MFKDRSDAGRQLVPLLQAYKENKNSLVVGLARGGVVVADEIARALHLPLTVIVVRKVGAPGNPELSLGAVTATGEKIFNDHLIALLAVSPEYLKGQVEKEKEIALKRLDLYLKGQSAPNVKGKIAILVDDGIATGASVRLAVQSLRKEGAKKIVLAVPVGSVDALHKIEKEVDELVYLLAPSDFEAVGSFYQEFDQVSDEEVVKILMKL